MSNLVLDAESCARALALRDLSDEAQGPHALQLIVNELTCALTSAWQCAALVHRASPVVSIADNYDRLHYPRDGATRDVVLGETQAQDLPEPAARRLRIEARQKNVLLRVVLRDLEKTLTHEEANELRDQIYAALHQGKVHEWAARGPKPTR